MPFPTGLTVIASELALSKYDPKWFQIFNAGEVKIQGEKSAVMDEAGANKIIDNFQSLGHDMVIDYEHQTLTGEKAPAAGWVKELQWRGQDGLWARAEWTQEASAFIASREYRYYSPVFTMNKSDRQIIELYNLALTNQPKLINLQALAAKNKPIDEKEKGFMLEKLKKLLGLAKEVSEDEAIEAVKTTIAAKDTEIKALKDRPEFPAEGYVALGLKKDDKKEVIIAKIKGLTQVKTEKSTLETSLEALKADYGALKTTIQERDRDEVVARALSAGKITPAQIDWAKEYALKDPPGFDTYVAKASVVLPLGNLPGGKIPAGGDGDAGSQLMEMAKARAQKDKVKFQEAFTLVCKENAALADQYNAQHSKGV